MKRSGILIRKVDAAIRVHIMNKKKARIYKLKRVGFDIFQA